MFYFMDDNQVTVYFADGASAVWRSSSPNFDKVKALVIQDNWVEIEFLHNQAKAILNNKVELVGDQLKVKSGDIEHIVQSSSPIRDFIFLLKKKGIIDSSIEDIKPFLINMFENPYIKAVTEIYDYCQAMDFEITKDGCFLAYKNVRSDLGSIHDGGRTKHIIGEVTEVEAFDTDRNKTCSKGLHFCSKEYLSSYRGDVTLVVKINPKDVVAIPTDYKFQKGRCRKYIPIGVIGKSGTLNTINVEAMTGGTVQLVKTIEKEWEDKEEAKFTDRIQQTVELMEYYNNIYKVAAVMGISAETVGRNLRKARARGSYEY